MFEMRNKIFLIGNNSEIFHVGSMLNRASEELGLPCFINDNSFQAYAPSMKYIWGKVFFKLNGKEPIEWSSFNQKTIEKINKFEPDIVIVTGIFPLKNEVFQAISKINAKIINFLTDDPWRKSLYRSKFISNLKKYDLIISTKSRIISDLIAAGVQRVEFLPYSYDPFWHHLPDPCSEFEKEKFIADISFVGYGDRDRLPMLKAVASIGNLNLKLYGNDWDNIPVKGWKKHPAVAENQFRLAMYSSKLALCLLRKRSRDDSTQRTFEIAPCGGCGIYEDTPEHRNILSDYPEYGFFSSPQDLANKCKWLLEHPKERENMRQLGIELIVKESNTYTSRLKTILEWVNKNES